MWMRTTLRQCTYGAANTRRDHAVAARCGTRERRRRPTCPASRRPVACRAAVARWRSLSSARDGIANPPRALAASVEYWRPCCEYCAREGPPDAASRGRAGRERRSRSACWFSGLRFSAERRARRIRGWRQLDAARSQLTRAHCPAACAFRLRVYKNTTPSHTRTVFKRWARVRAARPPLGAVGEW